MHVNTDDMRAGADRSYRASDFAKDAADALSRATVRNGIFGSFAAADTFRAAMADNHSNHAERMRSHHTGLGVLGDKTHKTASVFEEMEERNAAALRGLV